MMRRAVLAQQRSRAQRSAPLSSTAAQAQTQMQPISARQTSAPAMQSAVCTMRRAVALTAARGARATVSAAQTQRILLPASRIAASSRSFSSATVRRSSAVDSASSPASATAATSTPSSAAPSSPSPVPPYRTVLFASSPFSLPTLRALVAAPDVIRTSELIVVTPTDKVRGRGRELRESEFKREAKRLLSGVGGGSSDGSSSSAAASGIVIDLPADINFKMDGWELPAELLSSPDSEQGGPAFDVGVVVSFGYMLPARLLRHFRAGVINIHPSLLPRHRGSAPIQYAIARGESTTGVSIIDVHPTRMDGGDVISQWIAPMHPPQTPSFESMHDRLAEQGAKQLMHVLRNLERARECRMEQTALASDASGAGPAAATSAAALFSASDSTDPSPSALPFITPGIPPQTPSLAPRIPKHAGELLWSLSSYTPARIARITRALKGFTPIYTHFRGSRIEVKAVLEPEEAERRIAALARAELAGEAGSTPADFSFFPSESEARELGAGAVFFHGGLRALGVLCAPTSTATATAEPGSSDDRSPQQPQQESQQQQQQPPQQFQVLYITDLHLANKPHPVSAEIFAFGYLDKRVQSDPAHWKQWRFVCSADLPARKGQQHKTLAQLDYWTAKLK